MAATGIMKKQVMSQKAIHMETPADARMGDVCMRWDGMKDIGERPRVALHKAPIFAAGSW